MPSAKARASFLPLASLAVPMMTEDFLLQFFPWLVATGGHQDHNTLTP
jgi:hypothetical protein